MVNYQRVHLGLLRVTLRSLRRKTIILHSTSLKIKRIIQYAQHVSVYLVLIDKNLFNLKFLLNSLTDHGGGYQGLRV